VCVKLDRSKHIIVKRTTSIDRPKQIWMEKTSIMLIILIEETTVIEENSNHTFGLERVML